MSQQSGPAIQVWTPWKQCFSVFATPYQATGKRRRPRKLAMQATKLFDENDFNKLVEAARGIAGIAKLELSQVKGFFYITFADLRITNGVMEALANQLFAAVLKPGGDDEAALETSSLVTTG